MEINHRRADLMIRYWIMLEELKQHKAALAKHEDAIKRGVISILPEAEEAVTMRPELVPVLRRKDRSG